MIKTKEGVVLTPKAAAARLLWTALPKSAEYDTPAESLSEAAGLETDLTAREEKLIFTQYEKFLGRIKKLLKVVE